MKIYEMYIEFNSLKLQKTLGLFKNYFYIFILLFNY
jgi:hypothetical protein